MAPTEASTTLQPVSTAPPYTKQCPAANIQALFFNGLAQMTVIFTEDDQIMFMKGKSGIHLGPYPRTAYFKKSKIPDKITAAFASRVGQKGSESHILFSGNK